MNGTSAGQSTTRANRAIGMFSGSLVVLVAFAVYCWIASDGHLDSARILGIAAAVMALPIAFVVFAAIRMVKVLRRLGVHPGSIRFSRILKPSAIVVLSLALLVGIIASFSLDSLGTVGAGSKLILFFLGFLIAALIGMALVSLTSLLAYAVASSIVKREQTGG